MDMNAAIVPKSDQLNSDDLIGGPRTIVITKVDIKSTPDQPVSIFYSGDDGKPWKPCKSMSRVLVTAWGPDAKQYVGRSLTLYRDPNVKWGGMPVGGIRVSHMSDIKTAMTMALTETRGSRKPYTVKPMEGAKTAAKEQPGENESTQSASKPKETLDDRIAAFKAEITKCQFGAEINAVKDRRAAFLTWLLEKEPAEHAALEDFIAEHAAKVE